MIARNQLPNDARQSFAVRLDDDGVLGRVGLGKILAHRDEGLAL